MKLLIALLLASSMATADLLVWDLPTERENGTPILNGEVTEIVIYREGVEWSREAGTTVAITIPGACAETLWSATASIGSSISGMSAPITQVIDEVGCRPKPPAGLGILLGG